MDAIECILKRRSIRRYQPEPLAEGDLERIIELVAVGHADIDPAAPARLTVAELLDHRD